MNADLAEFVTRLQAEATNLNNKPSSRRDTAQLKSQINSIQTCCQHIFTEIKALNRSLPG